MSHPTTYQLTDDDIIEDLISRQDDQVLGYCSSHSKCYLALLLQRKYPELQDAWVGRRIMLFTQVGADPVAVFDLTEMQQDFINFFDEVGEQGYPVRKKEFLAHLKEQEFDYYADLSPTYQ